MINAMPDTALLLHGFTNTGRSWDGVVASLEDRVHAVAPDLRGHGAAADARPVTLSAVVADVQQLTPDPFTLVGYSMGGRIALHAAFAAPDRVVRLVLIGASPGLRDATARAERRTTDARLADELERSSIERFVERWSKTAVLSDQAPEVKARVNQDRARNDPAGLAAALRGLGTGALPSLWPRLARLPVPVELVVGERDQKFRAIAEQMVRALPDARLTVTPGAGHAVHWEDPVAVAEIVAARP
jgi:2-succinyl-6-hydroxy-2,4-cyclohexadiene-1-carboxylate synthase